MNPPNRFNGEEINEILGKSELSDKQAVIKVLKRLIKIILILLNILLVFFFNKSYL